MTEKSNYGSQSSTKAAKPATYSLSEGDVVITLPPEPLSVASVEELGGHLNLYLARAKKEAEKAEKEAAEADAARAKSKGAAE